MKKSSKKLRLSKRTLRTLSRDELAARGGLSDGCPVIIVGPLPSMDRDTSCFTGCCGILGTM